MLAMTKGTHRCHDPGPRNDEGDWIPDCAGMATAFIFTPTQKPLKLLFIYCII